ncbi:MAG: DUF3667 domain-containing protein [Flavobacterium sp.]|nr:MAG: DUF3667 domain-containing protein [Flavobacterium sp.]
MNCKNCNHQLSEHADYCESCGGKVIRNRLTMKNLIGSFSEQFLNYDNKFLRTFLDLFSKPEAVIGSYIDGTRKRYVNVVSYFAISITLAGIQLYFLNKFFPEVMDLSSISVEGSEEMNNKNLAFVSEYQSLIMMFYVPLYALISKVVFFNYKKYNYTEHLVIYMYILSQMTIFGLFLTLTGVIMGWNMGIMGMVAISIQIIYTVYCLKRLFDLSIASVILKTLLFLVVLFILFFIFSMIMAVIMLKSGAMEEMKQAREAQKAVSYSISSAMNWTS